MSGKRVKKRKGRVVPSPAKKRPEIANVYECEIFLKQVLTISLALYVITTSKQPVSKVIQELIQVEYDAGILAGKLIGKTKIKSSDIRGILAGVFSFIPLPGGRVSNKKTPFKSRLQS